MSETPQRHSHSGTGDGGGTLRPDELLGQGTREAKVVQNRVYAGHPDFSTLQDAIDFAANNGYHVVMAPPGEYGNVSISSQVDLLSLGYREAKVGISGGSPTSGTGIDVNTDNVRINGVKAGSSDSDAILTQNGNVDIRIEDCRFVGNGSGSNDITVQSDKTVVISSAAETGITLGSNSNNCVVDDCVGVSVTNNGTGNVVGDNS